MKVFVINLRHRQDRLQECLPQFTGHDISIIDAVDGSTLHPSLIPQKFTKGEVGCFLSHMKALQVISRMPRDEPALLVEDDVVLDMPRIAAMFSDLKGAVSLGNNLSNPYKNRQTFDRRTELYGAHAILYPRGVAQRICREWDGTISKPWDFYVAKYVLIADPPLAHAKAVADSDTQRIR